MGNSIKARAEAFEKLFDSICIVGTPLSLEWKGKKYGSVFRGVKPPDDPHAAPGSYGNENSFILADIPVSSGKQSLPDFYAPVIVRFITEGVIYGFTTHLKMAHAKVSLLVLDYPLNLEKHSLRTFERIRTIMRTDIKKVQNGGQLRGVILDFSSSGAKLGVDNDPGLANGEKLSLSLTLGDGTSVNDLRATVRNTRAVTDQAVYGLSFDGSSGSGLEPLVKFYEYCTT